MNMYLKEIAGIIIGVSIFLSGSFLFSQHLMIGATGITPSLIENMYPVLLMGAIIFGLAIIIGNVYCIIREKL